MTKKNKIITLIISTLVIVLISTYVVTSSKPKYTLMENIDKEVGWFEIVENSNQLLQNDFIESKDVDKFNIEFDFDSDQLISIEHKQFLKVGTYEDTIKDSDDNAIESFTFNVVDTSAPILIKSDDEMIIFDHIDKNIDH